MVHTNLNRKTNTSLLCVNTSFNHPPQIIKQLPPTSTAKRLSKHSSSIEIFNSTEVEYENALENSGYHSIKLNYYKQWKTNRNLTEVEISSGLTYHIAKTPLPTLQNVS